MEQLTDKTLILKLREGDTAAFRRLFYYYYQRLFLFACKFVEEDIAKDLVQDCFLELWMNRNRTEINSSFSSWFFTVVKNRCYKYLKEESKKSDNQNTFKQKLKEEELSFFIHSEKSILEFEVKDRIKNVLEQLPPKCSQVFNESRFNGLSNKDIADKYDISLKAVEKHISKALKLFREEFQDLITVFLAILFQNIL
ncbi:RNA polymerase sigma-70 factor [Mariniphaga sp.]|uniref:RNA polymerase sigma-70 factor n=1 Tax=Mariniphaga sp. TaxID=1954475 RepID=UPI003564160E